MVQNIEIQYSIFSHILSIIASRHAFTESLTQGMNSEFDINQNAAVSSVVRQTGRGLQKHGSHVAIVGLRN